MAEPSNNTFISSGNDITNGKKVYGAYADRIKDREAQKEASKHGISPKDNFDAVTSEPLSSEPLTDFSGEQTSDYNWIDGEDSSKEVNSAPQSIYDFGEFVDENAEDLKKRSWTQPTGTGAEKFHVGELPRTREEFEASGGYESEPVNEKAKEEFEKSTEAARDFMNKASDVAQDAVVGAMTLAPELYKSISGDSEEISTLDTIFDVESGSVSYAEKDAFGREIAQYTRNPDGTFTRLYKSGAVQNFDKDGDLISGNDAKGNPISQKLTLPKNIREGLENAFKSYSEDSTKEPIETPSKEPIETPSKEPIETPSEKVEEPSKAKKAGVDAFAKLLSSGSDEDITKAIEEDPEGVVKAVIESSNAKYAGNMRTDRDYGTEHTNKTRSEMYSERLQHLKETLGSKEFSLKDKVKEVTSLIGDLRDITLNGDLSQKERQVADVVDKVFGTVGSFAGPVGTVIAKTMSTAIRLLLGMDAGPYIQKYYVGNYRQGIGSQNGGLASISNDARDQLSDSFNPNDVGQSHGNYNKGLTKESDEKVKGYIRTVVRGQPHVRNLANKLRK